MQPKPFCGKQSQSGISQGREGKGREAKRSKVLSQPSLAALCARADSALVPIQRPRRSTCSKLACPPRKQAEDARISFEACAEDLISVLARRPRCATFAVEFPCHFSRKFCQRLTIGSLGMHPHARSNDQCEETPARVRVEEAKSQKSPACASSEVSCGLWIPDDGLTGLALDPRLLPVCCTRSKQHTGSTEHEAGQTDEVEPGTRIFVSAASTDWLSVLQPRFRPCCSAADGPAVEKRLFSFAISENRRRHLASALCGAARAKGPVRRRRSVHTLRARFCKGRVAGPPLLRQVESVQRGLLRQTGKEGLRAEGAFAEVGGGKRADGLRDPWRQRAKRSAVERPKQKQMSLVLALATPRQLQQHR
eukprot:scaffold568_cov233-Pinguiococcus_pyrenoidosus.AAC.6